jgi:hypothetical protein
MKARRPRNVGRRGKFDRVILAIIILLVVAAIGAMTFRLFATQAAPNSGSAFDGGATYRQSQASH